MLGVCRTIYRTIAKSETLCKAANAAQETALAVATPPLIVSATILGSSAILFEGAIENRGLPRWPAVRNSLAWAAAVGVSLPVAIATEIPGQIFGYEHPLGRAAVALNNGMVAGLDTAFGMLELAFGKDPLSE